MDQITYRPAEVADIPRLVELMNAQYTRKKVATYFLWQYFESAYPTVMMCAVADSSIVGMFGLQRRELSNSAIVGQAIDLLLVPDWRGKGIFKNLEIKAAEFFNDLDILCVLPNLNGKNACEKNLGWKTIQKVDSMLCGEVNAGSSLNFSPRHGSALTKFKFDADIRSWRYHKNPEYSYEQVVLNSGEFAITKIYIDPVTNRRFGDIVDFGCDLSNADGMLELFHRACLHLKTQDIESITTWALPHTLLYDALKKLGFVSFPQERYFCLKVLSHKYNFLYDISNWHLVQADAEIY